MSKCLSGSGPKDKSILFLRGSLLRPRQCRTLSYDAAPSNLGNRREGQERGGDEGNSYLAGIGHEQCPVTDT